MKAGYILLALVVLSLLTGCIQREKAEEVEKKKEIAEAKEIQTNFEEAYSELKLAIENEDPQAAKEKYNELLRVYEEAKEKAGEQHLRFMVGDDRLAMLKEQIDRGDFTGANDTLSGVAGSCGVSVCHQRSGGAMANLEYEYGVIKKALREGDLERAKQHFPEFKRNFYESRELTEKFLPELTEERMRDEYVENLERALEANDLEAAQKAMKVISENTCSLKGCHAIFFG
ncbi:hypothetical protein [Candidatus Pyrohabitans sp.]